MAKITEEDRAKEELRGWRTEVAHIIGKAT